MSDVAAKRLIPSKENRLSPDLKTKVPAAETPTTDGLMTLAVAVVIVAALYVGREVLIPITLAILLSFVLAPLVGRLRRFGLWRVPAVFLAIFLALGVILTLGAVIGTQVAELGNRATLYSETIGKKVESVRNYTAAQAASLAKSLGRSMDPAPSRPAPKAQAGQETQALPVEVHTPDPTPFEMVERLALPILGPIGSLGIVLVVAVFILMQMEDLRDRLIRLFGSRDLHRTTAALDDAAFRLSRYFLAQLALNAGFGVIVALGLFAIGVPSPALFGIIASLFRFVPYIGAVGAGLLPLLLAAAVDPGWTLAIQTLCLFVVVETITGQVLEPLAYGHSTGLSPVSVVISAIFWAWLWGPVGLILSMPLTLCLVVLGRHVEHLQFLDVLLGDQPALTPAESFYQRILAGDADEALDQAEILLKDRSVAVYYDDVAMRGLHMAANDSVRGVLTEEQLRHIQRAVAAVVEDLAEHGDAGSEREPVQLSGTVLCIAGRGPLDEAACTMLAQLLSHRGLQTRIVSSESVARGTIDTLDISSVDLICVSFLEAASSLSGLRYLMRRIHQRAPGLPTLVGLWQADLSQLNEDRLRSIVGADHYTTSLSEAVTACVNAFPRPAMREVPEPDAPLGALAPA